MNAGYIVLIVLFGIWVLGTMYNFFKPIIYFLRNNKFPEGESSNICVLFFDAMLWPSNLINLFFCVKGNRQRSMAQDEEIYESNSYQFED